MAVTSEDMKKGITELLEQRGVMNSLKAHLRAEVFTALSDNAEPKPTPIKENIIINSLILEYLYFNHLKYSASVLTAESGHRSDATSSVYLQQQFGVECGTDTNSTLPLLYGLVEYFLHQKSEKVDQDTKESS